MVLAGTQTICPCLCWHAHLGSLFTVLVYLLSHQFYPPPPSHCQPLSTATLSVYHYCRYIPPPPLSTQPHYNMRHNSLHHKLPNTTHLHTASQLAGIPVTRWFAGLQDQWGWGRRWRKVKREGEGYIDNKWWQHSKQPTLFITPSTPCRTPVQCPATGDNNMVLLSPLWQASLASITSDTLQTTMTMMRSSLPW
jgi:hypothetical protein